MEKTTLILGAGASVDYGYPTGSQLIQEVSNINFHHIFSEKITPMEWRKRLKEAQPPSIDYFMNLDSELMSSVKPYIFLYLLTKENEQKTLTLDYSNHWYFQYFNDKITRDPIQTAKNLSRISVITYNYDRSLEYYLSRMIKQRCYHNEIDYFNSFQLLNKMEIHHVYGRLPEFTSELNAESAGVEYGSVNETRLTNDKASRYAGLANKENLFKICYESVDTEDKAKYRNLIRSSHNVIFLGFGFHKENIDVLNYDFSDSSTRYFSTGYGLGHARLHELRGLYPNLSIDDVKSHQLIEIVKNTIK